MSEDTAEQPAEDTQTWPTETWVYAGERVAKAGKRAHVWIDQDGAGVELWYANYKTIVVGGRYEIGVERTEQTIRVHGKPRYIGLHEDNELRARLEVQHLAARNQLTDATRQRNDARQKALDDALAPLLALASKCSPFEREALLAHIIRRITAAW